MNRPLAIFLVAVACFYALGLNPWVMPESTDDIMYFELAKSHAAGNGHTFQGETISDWPPVWPLILSIPMRFGIDELWAGKLLSMLLAVGAILFAWILVRLEKRPAPWLSVIILAAMPTSFALAVRTSSDWVFAFFSFAFLIALHGMRESKPSVVRGVSLGLLLGISALTRSVGVLLGAAIVGQIMLRWWEDKANRKSIPTVFKKSWPEMMAAIIGGGIWLAWGMFLNAEKAAGKLAIGNYEHFSAAELWAKIEPLKLTGQLADLWFQAENILEKLGVGDGPIALFFFIVFLGILGTGLIQTVRRGLLQPSDFYAVLTVVLVTCYYFKAPRFLLVITPFLLSWFFRGLEFYWNFIAKKLPDPALTWIPKSAAALWIAGSIAICGILITRGNAYHAGLSPLVTKEETEFYKGYYSDLFAISQKAKTANLKAERIGIEGWFANYFYTWTRLPTSDWKFYPTEIDAFVTSPVSPQIPDKVPDHEDFEKSLEIGNAQILTKSPN